MTGKETDILGNADVTFTSLNQANGALVVHLTGVPVPAPYDIILLGPADVAPFGSYAWAVVSDPFELSLFVLARNITTFYAKYNATVFQELEALGFDTFLNTPIPTIQDGCPEYTTQDLAACDGEFGV